MIKDQKSESDPLEVQLQHLEETVLTWAKRSQGEPQELLALLRSLESLHRQVREEFFEPALPNTRHQLSNLLKEIQEKGGWPYIERMRLQNLIEHLQPPSQES